MNVIEFIDIPKSLKRGCVLRFIPRNPDPKYYAQRIDRNLGVITGEEQEILRNSVVGIAGTGGMGGLIAAQLTRVGIGEIRIADSETFDVSNINRQFGALRTNIGKSKALETARMIRAITDDVTLEVYPQGITEESVKTFVSGCDVICDEIEFLAIDARILLHQQARTHNVSLLNCNSVWFGSYLFLYTPQSMTMEEAIGLSYEKAKELRYKAMTGDIEAAALIIKRMTRAVAPGLPEYRPHATETDHQAFSRRLYEEGRVPILGTNPLFAAGFLADRLVLYLLRKSGTPREIRLLPEMPGYLYMDAACVEGKFSTKGWFDDVC
ncbi:ThiF family adenylyltransferase [Patescibacteria group bacterium]|nr:ThiF family adenylyltransferase [Patescibacteria group bacterium]